MKATLLKIMLAIFTIAALMVMSCEGPEGPAGTPGTDGKDGADGKDAQIKCMDCHNESTLLKAKIMQYEGSMHYQGTSYARGASGSCAPCHANEGYNNWIESGWDMASTTNIESPTPPACRTCHNIHETYSVDDYALKGTEKFNLQGDLTDNIEIDFGKGNQCAKCHQTRERNIGFDPTNGAGGEININSSHWGPHHGPQSNTVSGKGGYNAGNQADYATTTHSHGKGIADGCVSCHANTANHSFDAQVSSCTSCHESLTTLDYNGVQTEIKEMVAELEAKLIEAGLLAVEHEGEMGHPVSGQVVSNDYAGALFNYFIVYEDGSWGVHNPRYIKKLLENSIAVFN